MNARLIKTFTKRMTKTTRSTLTESIRKTITVVFLCALVLPVPMETSGGGETVPGSTGYIDTHMHLLGMGRGRGGPVKDYEAAAAGLVKLMDQMNVSKALIMPPPQHSGQQGGYDYRELLKAVKKFPQRLVLAAGGGILNPMIHGTDRSAVTNGVKKRFRKEAEQLLKAGAKAFGEMTAMHVSMNPRHPILETSPDHPLFLLLADIAAENNVPIDLHMEAVPKEMATPRVLFKRSSRNPDTLKANIPALERLLKHNRKARIVWQHIGWD
ncbi:MAG: hypothetical protein GY940_22365, partial [bacterium]|nr:hypothetical protein [bacterium]